MEGGLGEVRTLLTFRRAKGKIWEFYQGRKFPLRKKTHQMNWELVESSKEIQLLRSERSGGKEALRSD